MCGHVAFRCMSFGDQYQVFQHLTCLSTGVSHMRKRLKRPAAPSPVVWGLSWAVTMVTCSTRVRACTRG